MSVGRVLIIGGTPEGSIGHTITQHLNRSGQKTVTLDAGVTDPFYRIDLRDGDSVRTAVHNVVTKSVTGKNPITGVVYAAGVNHLGSVRDYTEEQWDSTVEVNAKGVWLVTQELIRKQEDFPDRFEKEIPFLVLGSNTAFVAKTRSFAYGFSKAGLVHMLKCMHRELAPLGWRFSSLDFGIVMDSGMTEKTIRELGEQRGWSPEETVKMLLQNVPTKQGVTRHEIAAWVKFLLDNPNFSYGGNSIRFDSGQQQG